MSALMACRRGPNDTTHLRRGRIVRPGIWESRLVRRHRRKERIVTHALRDVVFVVKHLAESGQRVLAVCARDAHVGMPEQINVDHGHQRHARAFAVQLQEVAVPGRAAG